MVRISTLIGVILSVSISMGALGRGSESGFPLTPDQDQTPGSLCTHPDAYRYPERIPYCRRNVSTRTKQKIFAIYKDSLGYNINMRERGSYKIDHLIPLCAGGSNNENNLWPQHKKVYEVTDPLEPLICDKMAEGSISQKEAVAFILEAKMHLEKAPEIIGHVGSIH